MPLSSLPRKAAPAPLPPPPPPAGMCNASSQHSVSEPSGGAVLARKHCTSAHPTQCQPESAQRLPAPAQCRADSAHPGRLGTAPNCRSRGWCDRRSGTAPLQSCSAHAAAGQGRRSRKGQASQHDGQQVMGGGVSGEAVENLETYITHVAVPAAAAAAAAAAGTAQTQEARRCTA